MINILRKFYKKHFKIISIVLVIGIIFLVSTDIVYADDGIEKYVLSAMAVLLKGLAKLLGGFLTVIIALITSIAQYNNFINEPSIVLAWTQIRDLANMFFILILLVIAFATILRVESYNFKKTLPKVIIMAVLINFSRTFCGFIIDISQLFLVFFLQFIGANGGSFIQALGVEKFFSMIDNTADNKKNSGEVDFLSAVVGMVVAVLFTGVAVIVLFVILMTLVMRVVMLWIYVAISPLAFLLASFPSGQKYASRWFDEFTKNVLVGPILAFFLWLALMVGGSLNNEKTSEFNILTGDVSKNDKDYNLLQKTAINIPNSAMQPKNFMHFLIAMGMLVGGLKVASEMGGAAGAAAGSGLGSINAGKNKITGGLRSLRDKGVRKTWDGVKTGGRASLGIASGLDKVAGQKLGMSGGVVGTGIQKAKNVANLNLLKDRNRDTAESGRSLHGYNEKKRLAVNDFNSKYQSDLRKDPKYKGMEDKEWNKEWKNIRTKDDYKTKLEKFKNGSGDNQLRNKVKLSHNGKDYKEDKKGNFYEVDDKGEVKDNEGNRKYATRKGLRNFGKDGVRLKAMSDSNAAMFEGWSGAQSGAWATAKVAVDEKTAEEQKKIEAENLTPQMMMKQIHDGSVSDERKMALALNMAIKDGFKGMNNNSVTDAKATLGSNQILVKKFNDEVDKKFAHLNHEMSTDAGRSSFKRRFEAGKVDDVMHESAYNDSNVLQAINESKGDVEFTAYVKKAAKASKKIKENIVNGLEEGFKEGDALSGDGELHVMRKAVVDLTGDVGKGLKGVSVNNGDIEKALSELFGGMSTPQKANLDVNIFNEKKMEEHFGDSGDASKFVKKLREEIKNGMRQNGVEAVRKNKDSTNKLVKELEESLK